jgi:GxxExxY protein
MSPGETLTVLKRGPGPLAEEQISAIVVDAAIEVHRTLGGPGLLESIYEEALAWELRLRGLTVERQVAVPLVYKGRRLSAPLRLDMLVESLVVVECKAVEKSNQLFQSQALTYIRQRNLKLALVINFGEKLVSRGIRRVINSR